MNAACIARAILSRLAKYRDDLCRSGDVPIADPPVGSDLWTPMESIGLRTSETPALQELTPIMPIKMKKKTKKAIGSTKQDYTSPRRLKIIFDALDRLFPQAECALKHENPFQLLVATILSAQCTDERVNKVTPELFRKYPTPSDFAALRPEVLAEEIRSTGFFRNKAKNITGAATRIVDDFGNKVPRTMDELLTLPGVARKTANVVLGTAYGIPTGVVVDTHVFRISHRLKLSPEKTPEKVEQDLMKILPKERWIAFGHQMIWFGRKICQARKPRCMTCPVEKICDSPDKTV